MKSSTRYPLMQYAARIDDWRIRSVSSSGGVFTGVARAILKEGGVVFGAAWEHNTFRVVHKWVDSDEGLGDLRGSKYVVSDMSGVYVQMRKFLDERRKVLFVGCPCQTAAIRNVFGDDPNLTLCALVCMANADAKIWNGYLDKVKKRVKSKIVSVNHRQKIAGDGRAYLSIKFEDPGRDILEPLHQSAYWKLFCSNARPVCRACQFRGGKHKADLQIGDFWGAENVVPEWNDETWVSAVLVMTARGKDVINRAGLSLKEVTYDQVRAKNPFLEQQYVPSVMVRPRFFSRCRICAGHVLRILGLR